MEKIELIEQTINKIDNLVKEQLPESKYQFELYDLTTNTKHFRGLDEPFHWGSVYKLFVVAEIIKMAEEGLLKMDDEIELNKEKYTKGSGVFKSLSHLSKMTIEDTCKIAISISDNLCADELLQIVGLYRYNDLFNKANASNSNLSYNLNDTVEELFSHIHFENEADFYRSESFCSQFNLALDKILQTHFTNVSDLNTALFYILNSYLTIENKKLFIDIFRTPTVYPRLDAYTMFSKISLFGKSGSLGYQTAFNQTALLMDGEDILAIVSILTKNNKHRNYYSVDIFGLIGLEIANLYERLYQQTK